MQAASADRRVFEETSLRAAISLYGTQDDGSRPLQRCNVDDDEDEDDGEDDARLRRGIFARLLRYVPSVVHFVPSADEKRRHGTKMVSDYHRNQPDSDTRYTETRLPGKNTRCEIYSARAQPINGYLHARKGAWIERRKRLEEFNRAIPIWERDRTQFNAVCLRMHMQMESR